MPREQECLHSEPWIACLSLSKDEHTRSGRAAYFRFSAIADTLALEAKGWATLLFGDEQANIRCRMSKGTSSMHRGLGKEAGGNYTCN